MFVTSTGTARTAKKTHNTFRIRASAQKSGVYGAAGNAGRRRREHRVTESEAILQSAKTSAGQILSDACRNQANQRSRTCSVYTLEQHPSQPKSQCAVCYTRSLKNPAGVVRD